MVSGRSRGRGFCGVVKRYGFSGLCSSHGVSLKHRSAGAIGSRQDPGRVWKGKKMPGRMGNKTTSIKNVKVLTINKFTGRILVSGSIPGNTNELLYIDTKI